MRPLREVANGDMSTIKVHVPFPMSDISQIQNKLGSFSQHPTTFIKEFQALTIAFDLTWQDIHVVPTACTHEEKNRIRALAQAWADEAQLCFQNLDGWGPILGWLNDSLCNYTLNFNQTSLEWKPWSEQNKYDVHEGNFTLFWGNSRRNLSKKYINVDYIPINSSALGTKYVGISVTTRHLLSSTSWQESPPKHHIIKLIFRNLLCQSPITLIISQSLDSPLYV